MPSVERQLNNKKLKTSYTVFVVTRGMRVSLCQLLSVPNRRIYK
jgi:hypothetical protein